VEVIHLFGGNGAPPLRADRASPQQSSRSAPCETAAGAAFALLVPYFPWRFDMPDPGTFAVVAAVLLFCAWRLCRRS
jgi:hypothetical protein